MYLFQETGGGPAPARPETPPAPYANTWPGASRNPNRFKLLEVPEVEPNLLRGISLPLMSAGPSSTATTALMTEVSESALHL